MTKYLMCIYWGHICIFISNMKFLSLILWLGGLCTDADDNTDANNANADAVDTNNYARRTNHDYMGLFGMWLIMMELCTCKRIWVFVERICIKYWVELAYCKCGKKTMQNYMKCDIKLRCGDISFSYETLRGYSPNFWTVPLKLVKL